MRTSYEQDMQFISELLRHEWNKAVAECAKTAEAAPLGTMPIDIARAIRKLEKPNASPQQSPS